VSVCPVASWSGFPATVAAFCTNDTHTFFHLFRQRQPLGLDVSYFMASHGSFDLDVLDFLSKASKLSVICSNDPMRLLFFGKQQMHLGWTTWIFLASFLKLAPNWVLQQVTSWPTWHEWTRPLLMWR
jgi:hypothetical protein